VQRAGSAISCRAAAAANGPTRRGAASGRATCADMPPDASLEQGLGAGAGRVVIGLDEAGRGPWAGPVMAAAVWLPLERVPRGLLDQIDDSKALAPERRTAVYETLVEAESDGLLAIGVGQASVEEIDDLNILQASLLAMRRAAAALPCKPEAALVDGNQSPMLPCPAELVIGGDERCVSIAAASIVAKVVRDRQMEILAGEHPGYGWERNRGYGTREHQIALRRLGITPQHRRSFRPIRELLSLTI